MLVGYVQFFQMPVYSIFFDIVDLLSDSTFVIFGHPDLLVHDDTRNRLTLSAWNDCGFSIFQKQTKPSQFILNE